MADRSTLLARLEGAGEDGTPHQRSKALFLSCMIDDRIGQIINPLLAGFAEKGWPDSYRKVFFTRLAEAAAAVALRAAP